MTISGVLSPVEGSVTYMERDIAGAPPEQIVASGICQVPEGRMIFPVLTVQENLELGAFLRKDKDGIQEDMEKSFQLFPRLKERRKAAGRNPERAASSRCWPLPSL